MVAAGDESLAAPLLEPSARRRDPFVEVRLYRRGAGPVAIFRSDLSGPRRAPHPGKPRPPGAVRLQARGLPPRPLDQESWTKPMSVIVAGLLVPAVMAAIAVNGVPEPLRSWRVINGVLPPWILVSAVIIFARARTRPTAP
ncbi:hypothetical protein BAE44_0013527 [Dichanthelium oligosanthes]|uniref:Uncharacterized protein n=1 Tax=Dichanthelium oligosanthes TaxID=888268 RepID=A0A1E5VK08_9POAL|nr:hypothetical protein BAE44_0013527 [Dichanthelium oligosanthes]